jgi:Tfp pilus assembly protein PilN
MAAINLLPKKFQSKDSLLRASRGLKTLNMVGTIVFFAGVLVVVGLIVVNQTQIKSLEKKNEVLAASIKKMNQVESQYILLKQRAEAFNNIIESQLTKVSFDNFEKIFIDQGTLFFEQADISKTKSEVVLRVADSVQLTSLLDKIVAQNLYKKVVISGFNYAPGTGYSVSLELN